MNVHFQSDVPVVTANEKVRKYYACSTSKFLILPGRDNRAMHNDYVLSHIFGSWSQTPYRVIAGFDSNATKGRKPPVAMPHSSSSQLPT